MLFTDITQSVGRTPLVAVTKVELGAAKLFVKLEARNPCGSVKDRVGSRSSRTPSGAACSSPGATLVEPTSGNTGIALAFVAAAKGYRLVLTMPEHISQERVALPAHAGRADRLHAGLADARGRAEGRAIWRETPGAVMLQQFKNPANPEVHRRTTAEEILGRHRRRGRRLRRGRGHRRHDHRRRRGAEGAPPELPHRRRRAGGGRRAVGARRRARTTCRGWARGSFPRS